MMPLIPTPDTIPVAWGWFQFLLMLTFPLHLLLMNAMLGATLVALYLLLKRSADETDGKLAHGLTVALPVLVAFAVNLGVAALLFIQVLYGHFLYTSSVLMGVFWIGIVPALILAYYAVYLADFRFERLGPWLKPLLSFAALVFLAIAFMLSTNMTLMLRPESWGGYFQHLSGTMLNLGDPTFFPRYLHMVIGATAVGGLFVALFGRFRPTTEPQVAARAEQLGLNLFAYLTMVQILLGLWFLISLPRPILLDFMGGDLTSTLLFAAGLTLALAALASALRRKPIAAASITVVLVYVMAFMRDHVRRAFLAGHFAPADLRLVPQYSPLILFLVTLVVGCLVVVWLLRLWYRALPPSVNKG
jgi:hypothetical protein